MPLPRFLRFTAITGFIERYLLFCVYIYLTWVQWGYLGQDWAMLHSAATADLTAADRTVWLGDLSCNAIMLALNFIMALVLLIGRRAAAPPRRIKEILVPLAASYYFVLYNYAYQQPAWLPTLPAWLLKNHAPENWQESLVIFSFVLGTAGIAFSVWGIISLGRSFGIFVAVRTVVLRGPYRIVRHPMYCGYIIGSLGMLAASCNIALAVLVPVQIALFAWRAKLEEARL
ncbi:MAG TPA: isoprenylcysteine carboxylmethyltransferase family protein, partial [Opitutales bacterium]|nr:isoprenylcysteine carboxylmethyltransferase family protein [Opitutales bacterium]